MKKLLLSTSTGACEYSGTCSSRQKKLEEVQWFDLEEVYEQCGKRREIFCVPEGGLGVVRSYLKSIEKN